MTDAGNLQNLNDIVVPGPVAWWPLAPGWYVLAAMAMIALVVVAVRQWRRWRHNCYRRQAMLELSSIREQGSAVSLQQLPVLLKPVWTAFVPVRVTLWTAWHMRPVTNPCPLNRSCSRYLRPPSSG